MNFFKKTITALLSYNVILKYMLLFLQIGFLFRVILIINFIDNPGQSVLYSLLYGLRMDIIVFSSFAIIISILYSLNLLFITRTLLTSFFFIYLLIEIATINYMGKFFSRPNYLFIEHLSSYTEMVSMLWKLYKIHLIVLVPILIFFTYNLSKLIKNSLKEYNLKYKILALPLVMLFLMIGARSSFDSSTPNQGYYTFSSSNIKNEIANNSIFSILYATYLLKKEKFYEYGEISSEKAIANINKINDFSTFDQNSLLRFQKSTYSEKKNIILIILESFGNDHVGYLGGTNTTPNLDSLTNESLYFTNLYATGARTSWGLSSILTSLYPIPSREYIKAAKSQKEFYTIAKTLKKHGYENTFIFPGDADFDNMRGFFLSNGYDKVLGKENFNRTKHLKYTWGYCDEALYEKAIDQIEKYKDKDKPFFLTMLTISSHEPFDYPKGRVKPYKNAKLEGFANSIKYADHSLGKFIVELKKKGLMENTVVAIIADHCNDANGEFDVPINRYKIPALILSEDFKKKRGVKYNKIASQIDFAPTILDVAGVSDYIPTVGSSILQNQRNSAILLAKRKNFAYLLQDSFIVYTGDSNIQTYNYKFKKIKNINKDVINGLSYIYGSKYLYDNKILYN